MTGFIFLKQSTYPDHQGAYFTWKIWPSSVGKVVEWSLSQDQAGTWAGNERGKWLHKPLRGMECWIVNERCKEIVVGSLRSYVDVIPWVQCSVSELVFVLFELVCLFLIGLHLYIITLLKLILLFGYFCLLGSQISIISKYKSNTFCLRLYLPCSLYEYLIQ